MSITRLAAALSVTGITIVMVRRRARRAGCSEPDGSSHLGWKSHAPTSQLVRPMACFRESSTASASRHPSRTAGSRKWSAASTFRCPPPLPPQRLEGRRADSSDDQLAVVFEAEDDGASLDDGRLASLTRFGGPQALSAFHIDGEAVRCCE